MNGENSVGFPPIFDMSYDDFKRLVQKAKDEGVRIFRSYLTGEWFATSVSEPELLHHVWLDGCDCKGFQYWGRCKHLAALIEQTGETR
jgi:hypothetical protein